MKSLNTLFKVFLAVLVMASSVSVSGQYVTIGNTGTVTPNGTTAQSPINIYFRSLRMQIVYTQAELLAAGFQPGAVIQEIGWNVTGAPLYAMPNYTIKFDHTTQATADPFINATSAVTVYQNPLYAPVVGGFDMLTLSTPFIWNGTGNLLVDVCFDQVNPTWNGSGQVNTYVAPSGSSRSIRSDAAPQCGLNTSANHAYKPVVQFFVVNGAAPSCSMVNNPVTATNVTAYTADLNWTHPGTPVSYLVEYGPSGYIPGTGTTVVAPASPFQLTGLNPALNYTARVRAVCGTAVGDTSFAASVNFTTLCATFIAPYTQNFAGAPNCWTQNQASVNDQWRFTGVMGYDAASATSQTVDGSSFAWLDFSYVTTGPSILTMGEVNIAALPSAALSFWYYSYFTNATGVNNILKVEASDGAGSWVQVATIQQNQPGWQFKLYDLSTFTYGANNNLVQIRFVGERGATTGTFFYNDIAIDDVRVAALPTSACAVQPAPSVLDFENGGTLNACWEQSVDDVLDWTVFSGATPSAGTGPSDANNGSYYAYIETSGSVAAGDSAILVSPPINTATLPDAPALYFHYHMFGNDYMTLRAEYEVFGSNSWVTLWERTGQLQTAATDAYASAYVPMPNAIGSLIRVRFTAVAGANDGVSTAAGLAWASDIAIDDVRIANVLANDAAVTSVVTPGNACGLGIEPISLTVTNIGFNDQATIPVFVSVNGGTPVGATVANVAGNGGTATATVLVDMTNLGEYTIEAYTTLPNDEVMDNDDFTAVAMHQPEITGEYEQGFEMDNGFWAATGDWAYGEPTATVINGAGAGDKAFVTNLAGNYNDSRVNYLNSPCFDLSTMTTPVLRFSIFWDLEDDWDGAWLEYSTSGGQTWEKLGANNFAGQNWYTDSISNNPYGWAWTGTGANGSGGWVDAIIDLQPYGFDVASEVKFRFVMAADGSSNNEGLGIDNFGIYDGCLKAVANQTITNVSKDGETDGAITLNAVGGFGGYTYVWSNGSTSSSISNLAVGTYSVTISDAFGCSTTETFDIVSVCPMNLGLSVTVNPEIGDDEDNGSGAVVATNGTAPYTYNWSNGATTPQSFNLGGDSYTVVVADAVGCTDTVTVVVETVYMVGTENLAGLTNLVLSPNPARDFAQLNINFDSAVELTVRVVDVTGRVIETRNAGNTADASMRFDVSTYAEGVYFMHIIANNQTATKRFVVVK